MFLQSGPHLVFDHWKCVQFIDLLLEPYWSYSFSGTEPYRALKMNKPKEKFVKTSGGPLSALTCCVNVRLLSGDKKNIAVNLFSKLGWELGLYYASYDDFHPDILARMYT